MSIIAELERVLKDEQECLLTGNFKALEELVRRKSLLTNRLAAGKPDLPREIYRRLSEQASHNETLLQSARLGLKAAMSQLREASKASEQSTYSRNGERQSLAMNTSSITQKI